MFNIKVMSMVSLKNKLSLINLMRVKLSKYKYELVSLYGVLCWILLSVVYLVYFFLDVGVELFSLIGMLVLLIEVLLIICSPLVYREIKVRLLLTKDWKTYFYFFTMVLIQNIILLWIFTR